MESRRRPARVLVTDGDSRAALAVTRSLGQQGYRVEVLAHLPHSLAARSRYAAQSHSVPDPRLEPDAWVQRVRELLDQNGDALLIPMTEVALGNLFESGLHTRADTLTPDVDAYLRLTDKAGLVTLAEQIGVAVPKSVSFEAPENWNGLPDGFSYPVVLKPRRSRWKQGDEWLSGMVAIATDEEDLNTKLQDMGMTGGFLLQEFLPGHGESVCLLCERGEIRAQFAHRRLREKPPQGGVSVLSESRLPSPELLSAAEKLLAETEWTGVAMVEFRREPSGRATLMEINPRFWGSLQLAIDAGVDFPALALALHSGEEFPEPELREGVRLRWLLGDFDHLLISLIRPADRAPGISGAGAAIRAFFGGFTDGSRMEVLRAGDRRPFVSELCRWFLGLVRG